MRRAVAVFACAALATGCVNVRREVRTERGPVLRSYERQVPLETGGGVAASVTPAWPKVTLAFERFRLCRNERVEDVVQERITESSARSAGPSFALGVTGTLVGGGLLALRGAFSDQPNTRYIDETGHYGPSPRQVAQGWSWVLLGAGVPALVVGIIGLVQSGQTVETSRVEQVASAMEVPCQKTPMDGEVQLVRAAGEGPDQLTLGTKEGRVTLGAGQLREWRLASVQMNGELVLLPEEEAAEWEAFLACSEVLPVPSPAGLSLLPEPTLVDRYNVSRHCALAAPAQGEAAAKAYQDELNRRRHGEPGPVLPEGPVPLGFEGAVEAFRPTLQLREGSKDLALLGDASKLRGQAAVLAGKVTDASRPGRLLLDVGGKRVALEIPKDAPWQSPGTGAAVRAVAVGVGVDGDLPVFRGVWLEPDL